MNIHDVSLILLWILVICEALALVILARQIGAVLVRLPPTAARPAADGPDINSLAPPIKTTDLFDRPVNLPGLSSLLIFISPTCHMCQELMPALAAFSADTPACQIIIIASPVPDSSGHALMVKRYGLTRISYLISEDLHALYQIHRSPYAVAVDASGRVRAKGMVNNRDHLDSLLLALFSDPSTDPVGVSLNNRVLSSTEA